MRASSLREALPHGGCFDPPFTVLDLSQICPRFLTAPRIPGLQIKKEASVTESKQKRVAFVTGAGPGLGASLVRRFAKEYAVAINARNAEAVRALASEARDAGGVAPEVPCDIGDRARVEGG